MVLIERDVDLILTTLRNHNVRTGDIILFGNTMCLSKIIEFFGVSEFSHVGLILNSNDLTVEQKIELKLPYDDLYIIHSTIFNNINDVFTKKINKSGCQINNLKAFLQIEKGLDNVYIRKLIFKNNIDYERFIQSIISLYKDISMSKFDTGILNLTRTKTCKMLKKANVSYNNIMLFLTLNGYLNINHTDKFLCSSFVSFIYVHSNLIDIASWSISMPRYLSSTTDDEFIIFEKNVSLSDNIKIYSTKQPSESYNNIPSKDSI